MRFKHEIQRASLRPDITPMIDVVFLLLIFFMLSSQFVYSTKIKVDLPKARTAKISQDNIVAITITKDGNLFIDDKTISFADLDKIFETIRDGRITIIADKETDFGMVIKVWDHARDKAIKEINIETKQ
jgi:biopolymer transport protein ExbD